jgi:hypothetical protein
MTITYHNGVSIAEIVVYVPCLIIAILLSIRHGFRRNAGWMFLIVFCLARIIGSSMQLATISQPKNTSLYTGSAILQNVGFSPLELASLGLLSRALESINKSHHTLINTSMLKFVELIILVGLILGIVGGVNASDDFIKTGVYLPGSFNKAGTALLIVSYVAIIIATVIAFFSISHTEAGEKRLVVAVAVALPFLLVRLVYSIFSTFTHNTKFNLLEGNVTILLCVALIEEFAVVVIYESVGLTLYKVAREEHGEGYVVAGSDGPEHSLPGKSGAGEMALRVLKATIIGRIVASIFSSHKDRDVELQHQAHAPK